MDTSFDVSPLSVVIWLCTGFVCSWKCSSTNKANPSQCIRNTCSIWCWWMKALCSHEFMCGSDWREGQPNTSSSWKNVHLLLLWEEVWYQSHVACIMVDQRVLKYILSVTVFLQYVSEIVYRSFSLSPFTTPISFY